MADAIIRTTIDGVHYDLDLGDITALDAKDFRREVGIPLAAAMSEAEGVDIDVIAGLVWLVRRKTERGLSYTDVASTITFNSDIDFGDAEEAVSGPEA